MRITDEQRYSNIVNTEFTMYMEQIVWIRCKNAFSPDAEYNKNAHLILLSNVQLFSQIL